MKTFSYICFIFFFAILIITTPVWAGTAIFSWSPPMTNADGTPLTDLAGYKIYYRIANSTFTQLQNILLTDLTNPSAPEYTVNSSNLVEGNTYDFVVTAYDTSDNESGFSNVFPKLIGTTTGGGSSPAAGGGGSCGMIKDIGGGPKNNAGPLLLNLLVLFLLASLGKLHCYLKRIFGFDFTSKLQVR